VSHTLRFQLTRGGAQDRGLTIAARPDHKELASVADVLSDARDFVLAVDQVASSESAFGDKRILHREPLGFVLSLYRNRNYA
jgi:hypothetical protein